ncbi:MAG: hypothetical protein MPI95_01785 [Nitrosopumilus sp.]|nr:hypothetical protein [Nitrosopumilus sp.]MDA7942997.1 hypothetical protein [Nitrosopumilus sp.]MDA7952245.1 hypothetical protein [Nitrosopumilus sp.]MDA7957810.1 hypothetical protein [Nitrosopumilus sp.]MDA7959143.1 hypothetical protein [Nitrosopumilus sp.]
MAGSAGPSGSAAAARRALLERWQATLSARRLYGSTSIAGSSPPSVFVGSARYPEVFAGPMLPPVYGDTSLLDSPERWGGMPLERIVGFRLGLVRGMRAVRADRPAGRYVEGLQDVAMSSSPADSELEFERPPGGAGLDGLGPPTGPSAPVRSARLSGASPLRSAERAFYDRDATALESMLEMYRDGAGVQRIQQCLSVGMLGRGRRMVPTRWSITATDSAISGFLAGQAALNPLVDSCRVFRHSGLGNSYAVVLYPRRWSFELVEAWETGGGLAFGSDYEDPRRPCRSPSTAGAFFAARLAVTEYLAGKGLQAGALVLRRISPEYSVPVGVWQVREGVRAAMRGAYEAAGGFGEALSVASLATGVPAGSWAAHGRTALALRQGVMDDYLGCAA